MSALEIVAVLALATAGSTVHGAVGIGFGLVAGPALVAIDPGFAPGPLLLGGQVVGLRHILAERAAADRVAWRHCMWGLPLGLLGGLVVLESMDDSTLGLLVGGFTALAAVALLGGLSLRRSSPVEVVAGAASSFAAVAAGIPGPPLVVAFSDMRPATLRSTTSMFMAVIAGLSFVGLTVTGNFGGREAWLLALLLPGVLIGLVLARHVRPHLERPWFRPLVLVVALIGGLVLIGRSL